MDYEFLKPDLAFLDVYKRQDWDNMKITVMDDETIRLREEISMQYKALKEIKDMRCV